MSVEPSTTVLTSLTNVLEFASRAGSKLPQRAQPGQESPPPPPPPQAPVSSRLPSDFRLTSEMVNLLQPALEGVGFKILDHKRSAYKREIQCSLAQNGGKQFSMLAVPPLFAKDPDGDILFEFVALEYFFEDGSNLCLLAENVDLPDRRLREIIEKVWPNRPGRSLRVKWLPWLDLRELQRAVTPAERADALKDLIGISAAPLAPAPQKKEMVPQDKIALIGLLSKWDEFSTTATRKVALGIAGLAQFDQLPEGTPKLVAGFLLLEMEKETEMVPHPIRMLIDYLLETPPAQEDEKILRSLLQKYEFLR